jgi:hypothetical protein
MLEWLPSKLYRFIIKIVWTAILRIQGNNIAQVLIDIEFEKVKSLAQCCLNQLVLGLVVIQMAL